MCGEEETVSLSMLLICVCTLQSVQHSGAPVLVYYSSKPLLYARPWLHGTMLRPVEALFLVLRKCDCARFLQQVRYRLLDLHMAHTHTHCVADVFLTLTLRLCSLQVPHPWYGASARVIPTNSSAADADRRC